MDSKPNHADAILSFYAGQRRVPKKPLTDWYSVCSLTNGPHGLGDCLILSWLPSAAKASARHNRILSSAPLFPDLANLIPDYKRHDGRPVLIADDLQKERNMGNGHFIQRLHRALAYEPPFLPKGKVTSTRPKKRGRVALHMISGSPHNDWQKIHVHPRARMIYGETVAELHKFIANRTDLSFVEIGTKRCGWLPMVEDETGPGLARMRDSLSECEYFIGIMSGPMHMATALDCKCVVIVNFPAPHKFILPALKDIDLVEHEWAYPQNCHLHQDGEGPLVKLPTADNLSRAIDGELYPYWSHDYLHLPFEKNLYEKTIRRGLPANALVQC